MEMETDHNEEGLIKKAAIVLYQKFNFWIVEKASIISSEFCDVIKILEKIHNKKRITACKIVCKFV